jgi:pectate lyase
MQPISRRHLPTLLGTAALAGVAATEGLSMSPATADGGRPAGPPSAPTEQTLRDGCADVLDRMEAPGGSAAVSTDARSVEDPIWSLLATGYASIATDDLPLGTVGGAGGKISLVRTSAELSEAAGRKGPTVILIPGTIDVDPFGSMIDVTSDTTIVGVGRKGELVGGGLRLPEVSNVVIRNLTFRDSYIPGDWDGKSEDNDNDGIRIDTSDHIWIDHCEFARLGDGMVDVRKDSTEVTLSWNYFHDHNKTIGIGWTDNLITRLTLHHNRLSNTHQRNGSVDQVKAGHLYNNWLAGISSYGTAARGAGQVLVEHSLFEHSKDPIGASDEDSRIHQVDNRLEDCWGKNEDTGPTIDPSADYSYHPVPARQVKKLLTAHAGPVGRREHVGRRIRVALDGSGDVGSIHAAVGAAWRAGGDREIVVAPGTYHEVLTIWPGADHLTISGESGDPADVTLTYDKSAEDCASVTVYARRLTLRDLTLEAAADPDPADPSDADANALCTPRSDTTLTNVEIHGGHTHVDPRDAA